MELWVFASPRPKGTIKAPEEPEIPSDAIGAASCRRIMQEQEQVLLQELEMEDYDSPVDNRSTGEPVHTGEPVGEEENFGQKLGLY